MQPIARRVGALCRLRRAGPHDICPVNAAVTGQQVVKGTGKQEKSDDDSPNRGQVQVGSRENAQMAAGLVSLRSRWQRSMRRL